MKVGLKETLSLLAAGYKKKDIEAMIAADEENEKETPTALVKEVEEAVKEKEQEPKKEPEPDPKEEVEKYKKQLDEITKKLKDNEEKLKKLQQDNVHSNSAPAAAEAKKAEADALTNLVRSFM